MKLPVVVLSVICSSILAIQSANAFRIFDDSDSDESLDYSDLFGDAAKGIRQFLGNSADDDEDSESDPMEYDKIGKAIMNAVAMAEPGNSADDDDFDIETIIYTVESLFDDTMEKLARFGDGAVNEFLRSLRDLIEVFIESEKMEETISQAQVNKTELPITNSSTVPETVGAAGQQAIANVLNITATEIDNNENTIVPVGQQNSEKIDEGSAVNVTMQNDNDDKKNTSEKPIETDENNSEKDDD